MNSKITKYLVRLTMILILLLGYVALKSIYNYLEKADDNPQACAINEIKLGQDAFPDENCFS